MSVTRRSIILAGGGMRVAYQAGVLLALEEAGITFDHGDGTSGGTMNLAMLLSGLSPAEMCERWRTLDVKAFASPVPFKDYLDLPHAMAMGDADGIVAKVFPHLGIDIARINASTVMDGTFNVCDFVRKTAEVIPHTDIDMELLVAGISLPIFMPPVHARGTTWTDAVWIKDANLMEAVRRGADELWVVWCIGNTPTYFPGPFRQYVHMIELSANGKLFEEFRQIVELNERIARGETPNGRTKPVVLHVIRPATPLPLDPDFFLGRIDARTLIDIGYRDTTRYLASMSPDGIPFTPEATQMSDDTAGITFRETMAGYFAMGETDPKVGAERGEALKTRLTMHATVTVRDVERFIKDPGHNGELTGEVVFAPLGTPSPASTGVFNLFAPTTDPSLRNMVYELGFQSGGTQYYLAGKKHVRDDAGLDLLSDTTTLYTTLHKGTSAAAPVVGAGVLTLGIGDFASLLATIRPIGTQSPVDGAAAVLRFGKFFAGQLADIYGAVFRGL